VALRLTVERRVRSSAAYTCRRAFAGVGGYFVILLFSHGTHPVVAVVRATKTTEQRNDHRIDAERDRERQ
jgi:hypothetical protein